MPPVIDEKSPTFPDAHGSDAPIRASQISASINDHAKKFRRIGPNLIRPVEQPASRPVADNYSRLFKTIAADTPALMEEVYRLRYQVYCVENQFLEPDHYPDGLEKDECDRHSKHALLVHRKSGMAVGTARIVLPKLGAVTGSLPLYKVCPEILDQVPQKLTAETSRVAISKEFKRRLLDGTYGQYMDEEELALDPRRVIPHISLGLLAVSVQMTLLNRCDYVCGVMEPTLLRLLSRFGMDFQPVGPVIEHHGLRQPCYAKMDELLLGIEERSPDLWEMITDHGRHSRRSTVDSGTNPAFAH